MEEFFEKYGDDIIACVVGGLMIGVIVGVFNGPFKDVIETFIGRIF